MNTVVHNKDWNLLLGRLRSEYGNVAFESWLKHIRLHSFEDGELRLNTPSPTLQSWVKRQYLNRIEQLWMQQHPHTCKILVECSPLHASNDEADTPIGNTGLTDAVQHQDRSQIVYTLNPQFTFDSFVMNTTNKLAYAAARAVADTTGTFNPLYICGGVGLGKTHLLHAIADHMHRVNPEKTVVYLSAERFMNLFTESLRNRTITDFKNTLRSTDVLLVDDIHFIANKTNTQEEFFHTFNHLIDRQCKIVLSGNTPPSFLQNFDERIISRMNWGVVAEIEKTDYALRCQILQTKAKQSQYPLDDDIVTFMARRITTNTRDLEGSLNRIVTYARLMETDITEQVVCKILHDILSMDTKVITTAHIQQTVAKYYNITVQDLLSKSRQKSITRPRQLAIYIAKILTNDSLPTIGRAFGGRDHTTALHAIRRIENLMQQDIILQQDIEKITQSLK